MARVKLSEYDAKRLFFPDQFIFSATPSTTRAQIRDFFSQSGYSPEQSRGVIKVDQGIKKRGKQGLVAINVGATLAVARIKKWSKQGWSRFLIEPFIKHTQKEEQYLSFTRTRTGWDTKYSRQGGVDIESHWDQVTNRIPSSLQPSCRKLQALMDKYHLCFLELNPVLIRDKHLIALDCAAEIDSTAFNLAGAVAEAGLTAIFDKTVSSAEHQIALLDAATPAALKFKLINPHGRIWMLLSGGGASLVLADEVADLGLGKELANYGEYSGAPSADDTYAYTKVILSQILKSRIKNHKSLVIAGGVANFTDVDKTFRGVIRALDEFKQGLAKAGVKVFVRRGGPNEEKGLANMRTFLTKSGLLGSVHGSDTPLIQVVREIRQYLESSRRSDLTGLKSIRLEKQLKKFRP